MIVETLDPPKPEEGKPSHLLDIPPDVFPVPRGGVSHTQSAEKIFRVIGEARRLFYRTAGSGSGVVVEVDGGAIRPVTAERFASLVEKFGHRVAAPEKERETGRIAWRTATYSANHARVALESDDARALPQIRQISAVPVITPEGETLGPGWHAFGGGLYVTGEGGVGEVPFSVAVQSLVDLLADFDFSTPADKARAVAGKISPALRAGRWIEDDFPLDVAEADASQSGKTYRQKIAAALYGCRPSAITANRGGVGSLDEAVAAKLIEGRPFIVLDNIRGKIDSPLIETAIRGSGAVHARALRTSATVDCSAFTWQLSTNGAELTVDLANRSIITRIRKRPEGYRFRDYPEGDLLRHVEAKQAFYLGCVFAVLREWLARGRPTTSEARHDFKAWVRALDWIVQELFGLPPLLDGHREEQRRMASPELQTLRAIAIVIEAEGRTGEALSASEIAELIEGTDAELPPSNDAPPMALGKMFGKIYRKAKAEAVEVDGFTVSRTVDQNFDGSTGLKSYTFAR